MCVKPPEAVKMPLTIMLEEKEREQRINNVLIISVNLHKKTALSL